MCDKNLNFAFVFSVLMILCNSLQFTREMKRYGKKEITKSKNGKKEFTKSEKKIKVNFKRKIFPLTFGTNSFTNMRIYFLSKKIVIYELFEITTRHLTFSPPSLFSRTKWGFFWGG